MEFLCESNPGSPMRTGPHNFVSKNLSADLGPMISGPCKERFVTLLDTGHSQTSLLKTRMIQQ